MTAREAWKLLAMTLVGEAILLPLLKLPFDAVAYRNLGPWVLWRPAAYAEVGWVILAIDLVLVALAYTLRGLWLRR